MNSPASPSFTLSGLRSAGEIHDAEKHQTQNIKIQTYNTGTPEMPRPLVKLLCSLLTPQSALPDAVLRQVQRPSRTIETSTTEEQEKEFKFSVDLACFSGFRAAATYGVATVMWKTLDMPNWEIVETMLPSTPCLIWAHRFNHCATQPSGPVRERRLGGSGRCVVTGGY